MQTEFLLPDVKNLGQVFTPDHIIQQMLSLRKNKGSVLEPSCGKGDFLKKLKGFTAIELDNSPCAGSFFCISSKGFS